MLVLYKKEKTFFMTQNQKTLITLVRESADPTKALLIAIEVISDFLKQPESLKEQAPACLQEHN